MAEMTPFRGVLYDPAKVGDVTAVVAPPYDVIGPAEQTDLYERHPCNVVRLELGQEHPGDAPQDNRYTRAKRFRDEWLRGGGLRRDGRPAIYLYAVEYRLPSGAVRTMRGFLSLVKLEEVGTGRIFPHENTRAAAEDDRYPLRESGMLPSDWVLMYFSNLDDPGLTILPTHRVLPGPVAVIRQRLAETFTLAAFPFTKETEPAARAKFLNALHLAQATDAHVMGLVIHGESRYDLLTLSPTGLSRLGPSARERLDVSILQQLVFRGALRLTPQDEERLIYIKDEEDAMAAVARSDGELAFLLNPPKVTEVKDVARVGDRMPHKSTYFYPKLLTGLVINTTDWADS